MSISNEATDAQQALRVRTLRVPDSQKRSAFARDSSAALGIMKASSAFAWLLAVVVGVTVGSAKAQTWGTATSTNSQNGRVIVFRFIDDLGSSITPATLPARIIIQWKYQQEAEKGMPVPDDHARMNELEDALGPAVEKDGFAALALVSTGEHLREWVYYAKTTDGFMSRLNEALSEHEAFPIEIHLAEDKDWSTWNEFKNGLRK